MSDEEYRRPDPEPLNFREPSYEYAGNEPGKPKKQRKIIAIVGTVVLVLGIIAGGYYGYRGYQEHKAEEAHAAAIAAKKAAKKEAARKHAAQIKKCEDEIGDYVGALEDIDSRLDIGLNQATLSDMAGDAASEQNDVDDDNLPDFCQEALDYADGALSLYSSSSMDWNECIWDDWCDPDFLDLQSDWSDASYKLEKAKALMEEGAEGTDA